jgi:hypothetical protein
MPADTAILMSDNRAPALAAPVHAASLTYPALAFALNALYACKHGYDLLYYQMVSSECIHERQGTRHASYCKLPAIAHALNKYSTVVFIDSDSFFMHRNLSLPALLHRYEPPIPKAPSRPVAWFANDLPQLGDRPNGGFHVWRRSHADPESDGALRLLRSWWHLPAGGYATTHDYEQHSLQWQLGPLSDAVPLMSTLQLRAMADEFLHAVAHIDHTKAERRLWVMSVALLTAAHEETAWAGAQPSARPHSVGRSLATGHAISLSSGKGGKASAKTVRRLLRQAHNVSPTEEPPPPLLQRVLRTAAELLGHGFGVPASATERALLSDKGVQCEAFAKGSAASAGSLPTRSRLRAVTYNASAMSTTVLPERALLGAEGLPVTLLPCLSASSRGEARASSGVSQRWYATASGQWRLVGREGYCLGIGPHKAPKKPYPMLAQLQRCAPASIAVGQPVADLSAAVAGAGAGTAVLQALEFSAAGMQLRSRMALGPLRAALLALASRMRHHPRDGRARQLAEGTAMPRRGRRLKRRNHEHGTHGKQARHKAAKHRKPAFWQDGSLSAAAAAQQASGDDARLCLSTWRGQLNVGSNLVFVRCGGDGAAAKAQRVELDVLHTGASASTGALLRLGVGGGGAGTQALCASVLDAGVAF